MSQESCDALFVVLTKNYAAVRVSVVNNLADLEAVVARRPDLVFLGMEYVYGELHAETHGLHKVWVTRYLDDNGISYTGSSQPAHMLERNKNLAKQRVQEAGLKTAPFLVVKVNHLPIEEDFASSYPLFVKPRNRGGGVGIDSDSVVYDFDHLLAKVNAMSTELQSDALIEKYLSGREFSVAILKMVGSEEYSVMPIELIAPPDKNNKRILSDEVKTSNAESAIEVTDEIIKSQVMTLALNVFHALGAQDYGRIDIRLDKDGVANFLEANLIPSLISGYGSFPKACMLNLHLDYEPMIVRIVELGLKRSDDHKITLRSSSDSIDTFLSSMKPELKPLAK